MTFCYSGAPYKTSIHTYLLTYRGEAVSDGVWRTRSNLSPWSLLYTCTYCDIIASEGVSEVHYFNVKMSQTTYGNHLERPSKSHVHNLTPNPTLKPLHGLATYARRVCVFALCNVVVLWFDGMSNVTNKRNTDYGYAYTITTIKLLY